MSRGRGLLEVRAAPLSPGADFPSLLCDSPYVPSRLTAQIRRLSELLSEASMTLDVIATELDQRASKPNVAPSLMGEDVEPRREFIEKNALSMTNLDI